MRIKELKVLTVRETDVAYDPQIRRAMDIETLWRDEIERRDWYDSEKECMVAFHLDTAHRINGYHLVSLGDLNSSIVHPREVFRAAILNASQAIILAHNHPSGDPNSSSDDIHLTKQMQQAGDLLHLNVLDHVIIGRTRFLSMQEKGLL